MNLNIKLQTILRRMGDNIQSRLILEAMLPFGTARDEMIEEIDRAFQTDLQELNRLCPEPSLQWHEL